MQYNPNIHNRKSIRLKEYDYTKAGMYFITICTKNREKILSKITEIPNMQNVGADASVRPNNTRKYPNNVRADASVCPVKINLTSIGIIIETTLKNMIQNGIKLHTYVIMPNHIHFIIELIDVNENEGGQRRPPLQKIIQGLKSVTARKCFKFGYRTIWQRNYYEHIIRNEKEYIKILEYIQNNPLKWSEDEYNS